jgi:hypothetical protein
MLNLPAQKSEHFSFAAVSRQRKRKKQSLCPLCLVYLCQELFLMLFHETGKNIFKIALVIENVTLSNPGL